MAKKSLKTAWFCTSCGGESTKWEGRCKHCGEWGTLVEEKISPKSSSAKIFSDRDSTKSRLQLISEIEVSEDFRIKMPSGELNRVLGGGLVPGSLVLIGGEPGIGKSTLILQNILSIRSRKILYVSGEESPQQIKLRADRIGRAGDNCYLVTETSLDNIFEHLENLQPGIVVIDSIQTMYSSDVESSPGSVSQIRECAARFLRYAKENAVPVFIVGHITKEGSIAGPKILEHIVDVVLQFEGDNQNLYRILRSNKNRFGNTSEIGVYEMCQRGLREVANPSELLLGNGMENLSGIATGVTIEGSRPLLIEIQALVSTAAYGTPQRSVTGFDHRRMNMLLAVLEKRVGFKLIQKDVFLNIAGGFKVNDPGLDLPVISSVMSSNIDISIPKTLCMTGEISLSGEIRPVSRIEQRIGEAEKLGMKKIFIPEGNLKGTDRKRFSIDICEVNKVEEAFKQILRQ